MLETQQRKAKFLIYDIENIGIRGWAWEKWDTNILHIDHYPHFLSFAWKWLGEKQTHVLALDDFAGYKKDKCNDLKLITKLHGLCTEADIVCGHNARAFDNKMFNTRCIYHKLPPPEPFKIVDTLTVLRKYGRFPSNKLDDVCDQLGIGRKVKHGDFEELWLGCEYGDPKAWATMKKYNKVDVELDESLYLRILPWIENHPSISLIEGRPDACPKCGSTHIQSRGVVPRSKVGCRRQYQCMDCLGWIYARTNEPLNRVEYVS